MSAIDTRLVQTAVIGTKDSDQPVILPEVPYHLDQFRRHFHGKRFWCGSLLGGCGGELMTKRYETKVCHFAHYPDRMGNTAVCHRVANGADSADHLFIKRDMTAWLKSHGLRAQAELRNLGHSPGDAVDFWLPASRQRLRFQLSHQDYRTWYRAEQELGTSSEQMDWVFGTEGPISANMVQRQGYALRVRCETAGSDRRVLIGVERPGHPVAWSALDDCRLTAEGLVTPALEDLLSGGSVTRRGKGAWLRPATFPLRPDHIVFAIDAKAPVPKHSPLAAEGRYIITADVKPAGSRIIRAHVSLPDDIPMPTEQYVYRLYGAARLLLTDPDPQGGVQWAVRADGVTQLSGIDAERTGLWRPGVALPEPVQKAPPVSSLPAQRPVTAPATAEYAHSGAANARSTAPPGVDPEIVARVRRALESFAKRRTPTTWSTLGTVARLNLSRMSPADLQDLLVAVDSPATPDKPVLSALVQDAGGRPLPDMTSVIRKLGLRVPADMTTLWQWCGRERERAYHAHGVSRVRMIPARFALNADGRASDSAAPPEPGKRAARPRTATPTHRGPMEEGIERLRQALTAAEKALPHTSGRHHERLSGVIKGARRRLETFEAAQARGTAYLDWLGSRTDTPGHHAELLTRAIKAVERRADRVPVSQAPPPKPSRPTSPPATARPNPPEQPAEKAVAEAPKDPGAEAFDSFIGQFREAQRTLDVDRAERIYRLALPLYRQQLSPALQHQHQALVAEMKTWVGVQQPNRSSALRKRCRRLLHQLRAEKDTLGTEELSALVAEAKDLSERAGVVLSDAEREDLGRWQQRLEALRKASKPASAAGHSRNAPPAKGRLSPSQVLELASMVRPLLQQTARGQSLTTWSELRRRLGDTALPHLHPDDQGEILVAVDHDTPANEPLLSSLIVVGDGEIHPLYRHVAFSLGRDVPLSDAALRSEWTVDVLRLRTLWKHR